MSDAENKHWYVYILLCSDNTLYTGITTDPKRRIQEHNAKTGAKYTRSRTPVSPVYTQICETKSEALKLEAAIKKLTRQDKIKKFNLKL